MTANNDIDDDSATKHSDSHTLRRASACRLVMRFLWNFAVLHLVPLSGPGHSLSLWGSVVR